MFIISVKQLMTICYVLKVWKDQVLPEHSFEGKFLLIRCPTCIIRHVLHGEILLHILKKNYAAMLSQEPSGDTTQPHLE
ncbi:hypothetical protein P691DRAFT_270792 [Macrolepiota fuliginosa MF-IS2]|uniref:Uncharacterized protein n=1 Tax=Macrolepiota fuliginosa MF-IS2 TaxID=1400762 RepID=A0A9P5X8T2_9AGAR|nr:hypothetical protein P691DRAFT_270792 [Macrolepiota fuliginosa MF-IS2]